MSRSLKKGPFVANHLLKSSKLNDQDDKSYPNLVTIIYIVPIMIGHTQQSIMVESIYLYLLPIKWLVIN
jgi:ribosomal protein S19